MTQLQPFSAQCRFTQVHNYVFDHIMPELSPNAWKILCFIIRKTTGWQKNADYISYSQIRQGTGIASDQTINNNLQPLLDAGYVRAVKTEGETTLYVLNTEYTVELDTSTEIKEDLYKNQRDTSTEIVDTKDTVKETIKQNSAPAGAGTDGSVSENEQLSQLLTAPELSLQEAKQLLTAHADDVLVDGKSINCNAVVGKVFKRRFGENPHFGRLAGLAKFARKRRNGKTTKTIDWQTVAEVIDAAGKPHGDIYRYLFGILKERKEHPGDEGNAGPRGTWCLRYEVGEGLHPLGRVQMKPATGSVVYENMPTRRVLYDDEGALVKSWMYCAQTDAGWEEADPEEVPPAWRRGVEREVTHA